MTAAELVALVEGYGVRLLLRGGRLVARPKGLLEAEHLLALRQARAEVVAYLTTRRPPCRGCSACGDCRDPGLYARISAEWWLCSTCWKARGCPGPEAEGAVH